MNWYAPWIWYDKQHDLKRLVIMLLTYIGLILLLGFLAGWIIFCLIGLYRITYHLNHSIKKVNKK